MSGNISWCSEGASDALGLIVFRALQKHENHTREMLKFSVKWREGRFYHSSYIYMYIKEKEDAYAGLQTED